MYINLIVTMLELDNENDMYRAKTTTTHILRTTGHVNLNHM